jgi:putative ABC transport system permease protein
VNWQPPLEVLAVIILAALLTTLVSVLSPAKRIEEMSIVNVVNAG